LKLRGDKRDSLIKAGKTGHRVLIFGKKVFGDFAPNVLSIGNAQVDYIRFPDDYSQLQRLAVYTLVILDYAAFDAGKSTYITQQEVFEKQMIEALDAGTTFCFVHYNEFAPRQAPYLYATENMVSEDVEKCRRRQIGFRFLDAFSIRPYNYDQLILDAKIKRNEFKSFLDKWGASYNLFVPYSEGNIDDVISGLDSSALGFTLNSRKSRIIYLPFQRDFSRGEDLVAGLNSLIDCLLTYITRTITEIPDWGHEPFFEEENVIRLECEKLEKQLEETLAKLHPFDQAKALLFQSEYTLESTLPRFIQEHLGINTLRDETYKEDFWILNTDDERCALVESKSMVKGFKKSAIFSLYNHRESNKLSESFPAVLFANCNLQAGTWKEKEKRIDKQDYEVAAQNNILVLRIEDLLRLWDARRCDRLNTEEILTLLISKKGWLEVTQDLKLVEHK
jgi:hypothetical protein